VRSPATYLNEDRYGEVELPAAADPTAPSAWEKVADGTSWEWHDHRMQLMSRTDPPQVRALPDQAHHILNWEVPALKGDEPLVISGSLDYVPPAPESGGSSSTLLVVIATLVGVVVVLGALVALIRARGPRSSA
jgi:hypothetical protein